jgi:hypothetical protein
MAGSEKIRRSADPNLPVGIAPQFQTFAAGSEEPNSIHSLDQLIPLWPLSARS